MKCMTLGGLISHSDGAGQYEAIGIHCVRQLISLLQGTTIYGGKKSEE